MLDQLPISAISSFAAIVLVVLFFITSSDSGSLVIDKMCIRDSYYGAPRNISATLTWQY